MPPLSPSPNAYGYPLLIKHLLAGSQLASACQEIVSGSEMRLSYADLGKRVRQLANSLKASGIHEGMRVGVMDWDTHRYLECFLRSR
jgi:fatty-acyl-CoA synthase